jgi:hypothetical protein
MFIRQRLPRMFALAGLAFAGGAVSATGAPLPTPLIPVVLKVDDLSVRGDGDASARWKRITDFALERKIKLSIGLIAKSLEGNHPAYDTYLRELQKSGLIEFWFHGYDHGVHKEGDAGKDYAEFANRPYEEQKRRFDISQKLAVAKLGAPFTCYGPPGGGNTQASDADWEASCRVMSEDPAMKLWLYPKALDERGVQLQAAGKVAILDRVYQVNIEQPLFVPNPEKFIGAYTRYAPGRRYFILQGHPDQWDDVRWSAFVKLVDYLQENHIPIVTPSELAASLSRPSA